MGSMLPYIAYMDPMGSEYPNDFTIDSYCWKHNFVWVDNNRNLWWNNPPTPAFAKAGAAPGTTGGVELGSRVASKGTRHQGNTSVSYMPQPSTCSCRTLTPTCPCHLVFRTFKTAVCPPSNPPNAANPPAGLQGNNSYSYMPLPSVFQGVQDCRLPALTPSKRFRRASRQQLLQQGVPDCRLPALKPPKRFRRPPWKATTLTATCPCHLVFRTFKTAACPASNPPNASNPPAGLQGNNSYSYMPLPSGFQEVQDCRLPALNPPNASNPPAGLQGNNSYSYMSLPSVFQRVQDCSLPGLTPPKRFQPSRRPQTPQTLPTLPQASKATTLTATCPCHLFFRGFKTAVCPPSNPPNAPAGLQGNNSYSYMPLPSVFQGVQDCRLPGLKPPKRFQPSRRPPRQQLLQLRAPAICFSGGSRLPFARPQTPQTLPQASKATTLTATCPCRCHLFFRRFKTAVCPPSNPPNAPAGLQGNNSYSYMPLPLPSVFQEVQDCHLPALKPPKRSRRPPRQQLLQLHAPAICFSRGSRLPFARPQTPQTLPTLPRASKATTLTATCPCHLFFRGFQTAVCPPSNPPNASAGLQGSYSYMPLPSFFRGVQDCRLPALKPRNNSYSYMPLPSVFQGVQDCRLPGLQPPKRCQPSRRPPRQQLLQLHAPAICFSGSAWATRACDSPPLMGLLLWHEPFCFLAWFPSRRVMVDVNLPRRTAWPHNSLTHRAGVGMAPRLSADTALLHIKLVAAYAPMVYSPRFGVTWRFPIAKWAYVHVSFCHCADTALLHIKSVAANAPMVYSPRSGVAYSFPVACKHKLCPLRVRPSREIGSRICGDDLLDLYAPCSSRIHYSNSMLTFGKSSCNDDLNNVGNGSVSLSVLVSLTQTASFNEWTLSLSLSLSPSLYQDLQKGGSAAPGR